MIDKISVFENELALINDKDIQSFTEKCILKTPDYFYHVPASSTGKYHPEYSLGDGGLIRHTKALVYFAKELLSLEYNQERFTSTERDIIISAGILHDSFKHGDSEQQYSIANHPVVAADHILEWAEEGEKEYAKIISDCIRSHMGQWNTDYKTKKEIMPKPQTDIEMFVHECDYLASRKPVIVKFENYYVPENFIVNEAASVINEIIKVCKEKVANGYDRDKLKKLIADNNDGSPDPRKIHTLAQAKKILELVMKTE